MLLTVSNLHPRPDQPNRGVFNAQLFSAMADRLAGESGSGESDRVVARDHPLQNIVLVPEWRIWRWAGIRRWTDPARGKYPTRYVPFFHAPLLGRNVAWRFCSLSLGGFREAARTADAVYAAWLYPDGVAAADFASGIGVPAWIMVQGSDTWHLNHSVRRRAILRACEQARGIVCVSQGLADRLVRAGITLKKIHVVPNGVDTEMFRPRPRREARRSLTQRTGVIFPDDMQMALFVGNLVPVKGADLLLDAWAQIGTGALEAHPRRLFIVGDGPMRRGLERRTGALGIEDRVQFLGRRPHEEIPLWMNAADCLCLTSRDEGMPNVVLEALACGLPVAAADVGACRDVLNGEETCVIFPRGDTAAAARALGCILSASVDRPALAERHRGRYSWARQARQILDLMAGRSAQTVPL